ncbi:MAG TPA: hypothetical protein VG737_01860 [Cyclobacteriaceae bacterium]|nr:hypothetical protein [Cyclobacteriaceae bacterium]
MKYWLSTLLLISIAAVTLKGQDAKVIFYCDPKLPLGVPGFNIHIGETDLGRLEPKIIISYSGSPGEIKFQTKTEEEGSLKMILSPGVTYYVEVSVVIGPAGGRPVLREVTAKEGQSTIGKIKPERVVKARMPSPGEQLAKVIIYRKPNLPTGIPAFDVYVDDKNLGPLQHKLVFLYSVMPGIKTLHAKTEQEGSMVLELKAKTIYYIEVGVEIGSTTGRPIFRGVPKKEAMVTIKKIDRRAYAIVKGKKGFNFSKLPKAIIMLETR